MHTLCNYTGASRTIDGDLCISFSIDEDPKVLEQLERLKDKELTIDVKKYNRKRSLNANAYFWHLCDEIAKALGSDKDTIYIKQLKDYGVFEYIEVISEGVKYLKPLYRFIEIDHNFTELKTDATGTQYMAEMSAVKCYIGSSHYDTKEMADLINGTVYDANLLGVDTWTNEEIQNLINNWEGRGRYENEIL